MSLILIIAKLRKVRFLIQFIWKKQTKWKCIFLQSACKKAEEVHTCTDQINRDKTSMHCISAHTHAHTEVALIISFVNHSIPGWATIRDSRPEEPGRLTVCLTDWVLVLPYSGVYCVNAGLWVIRSTEWTVLKRNTRLKMDIHRCCDSKWAWWNEIMVCWGESRLLAGELSYQTSSNWLWALPETHLLCSDLLCMHTVCVSFCLD